MAVYVKKRAVLQLPRVRPVVVTRLAAKEEVQPTASPRIGRLLVDGGHRPDYRATRTEPAPPLATVRLRWQLLFQSPWPPLPPPPIALSSRNLPESALDASYGSQPSLAVCSPARLLHWPLPHPITAVGARTPSGASPSASAE